MKAISLLLAAATLTLAAQTPALAEPEPVEYVVVCSAEGDGYAYAPGTEDCVDMSGNSEGIALAIAMPTAFVEPGKSFGVAVGLGLYNGSTALGLAGAFQAADDLTINGSFGVSVEEGDMAGQLGMSYAW